ncbi:MAG: hypothetical protein HQL37_15495 [Alphaproteobacteria bacterium]|nr:hypothetical protein [Alphaproteobacteria bacterium]
MNRLHTSFVLGYHGCSETTGEDVLAGRVVMKISDKQYDWLGPGIYFWEADPVRALEWARSKEPAAPFVVGAIIDLGNCLDLMSRRSLKVLRGAYESLKAAHDKSPSFGPFPENKKADIHDEDRRGRYLDCAVVKHLQALMEHRGDQPFDTVRGLFTEGGELFPGSGFSAKTHVQVAVRSEANIKGYFRVSLAIYPSQGMTLCSPAVS